MSTTYRWTVWTESTAEMRRGGASGHGTLTFKRDSKAATEQAMKAFYQTIRQNMPTGARRVRGSKSPRTTVQSSS